MSDTLRLERDKTGLSRERVAAQLDPPVSAKTLERWENETTPIPGWRLTQLRQIYATANGQVPA